MLCLVLLFPMLKLFNLLGFENCLTYLVLKTVFKYWTKSLEIL